MSVLVQITVSPEELEFADRHRLIIAKQLGLDGSRLKHLSLRKRSIDSRRGEPKYVLSYEVWVDELPVNEKKFSLDLPDVSLASEVLVIGSGPAGLFAALKLIELGLRPIVLERGKSVRERRHDIARINKQGIVDSDSNYCFGEGGAGTFSDGKLYTRSTKRGSVDSVLNSFVYFGADPEILVDAHPHIGTNKLPKIVQSIREAVVAAGGEVRFSTRVEKFITSTSGVSGVVTSSGERILAKAVVLATGHSARDIFHSLSDAGIEIESKPFALGVRVEHPQSFVDAVQYRCSTRATQLPAASYALKHQVEGRGVFSFCMCPGGIICPAATSQEEVVVNGWSPSKRNSYFANSGIVVQVTEEDYRNLGVAGVTAGVQFQSAVEVTAAKVGGGNQVAPAQRLSDLVKGKVSQDLPRCSYIPSLQASNLSDVLPQSIYSRLKQAFIEFDKKFKGYLQHDAIAVAVESRTSSPIRIPRDPETLMHVKTSGLFPCGEGAGYAGGIVSAAMDGQRVAEAVYKFLS